MTTTNDNTTNDETKLEITPHETSFESSAIAISREREMESHRDEKKTKKDKMKDEKKEKKKIEYEASMPRDEAVSYFEALVGGLRSGRLEFRQNERVLVLTPPERLEVEVTAQRKGDKGKVVFEIEWDGDSRPLEIISDPAESNED